MHLFGIISLPPTLLLLVCAPPAISQLQWPHNLPRHMKYFPEDEVHVKRSLGLQERLRREKPIGVKKMSTDEGEMFFLDNWIFAGDGESDTQSQEGNKWLDQRSLQSEEYLNLSFPAFSPLRPHSESSLLDPPTRHAQRAELVARDFRCPEGTNNCASIGAPDSCCATTDTCINVQDTGFGSVGCCPRGTNCAGSISCDTRNGYSACPDSPNGGCCLPGYSCQGVGCE
jgi:progranulin